VPAVTDFGYNYYPVEEGLYWIYKVDSISFNDNTHSIDTFSFNYKEVLSSSFIDSSGIKSYRLSRYFKENDSANWEFRNDWFVSLNTRTLERVEDNIRFIKLLFPIDITKGWNGNLYNSLGRKTYTYNNVGTDYFDGFTTFRNTLTVLQEEEKNPIEEILRYEVYAQGIGIVFIEDKLLNTQMGVTSGYKIKTRLIEYGK